MDTLHAEFGYDRLPTECTWQTVVLIPKVNGQFRGIGILEVLLVTLSGVINWWIGAAVQFHYVLNGFRVGRGTGTASLQSNLIQNLTEIR